MPATSRPVRFRTQTLFAAVRSARLYHTNFLLYEDSMPRVIHFEISADDTERAKKFYTDLFGWQFQSWGGGEMDYHVVMTGEGPGINGGMFKRRGDVGHVNTIDVPSVDEYSANVIAGGGEVVVPKTAIPGVGWLVYCKDTEGSIFGMMESDASAA
jgi:uncharacterized protein